MDSKTPTFTIGKAPISTYIGSGCRRRLWLDSLGSDEMRQAVGAVIQDRRRVGSEFIKEQGHRHETERFKELIAAMGDLIIRGDMETTSQGYESFKSLDLKTALQTLKPGGSVIEAQFKPTEHFLTVLGLTETGKGLRLARCRPDIVHMVPAADHQSLVTPSGDITRREETDRRPALLCFDIKLAMEPGPKHFAEIAYYAMALASWLETTGLSKEFAVLSTGGIWAGPSGSLSKEIATLRSRKTPEVINAWYDDIRKLPLDAVLGRVRRAIRQDLVDVLNIEDWKSLPIHVDARCAGCDYLGYEFFPKKPGDGSNELPQAEKVDKDENYCLPSAERSEHLSRIPGMTEAAAGILREAGIHSVSDLADASPEISVFDRHQVLSIERHAFVARAQALRDKRSSGVYDEAGTTMLLPRFSDIRVAISIEFDSASGRCFAFGYQMVAAIPKSRNQVEEHRGDLERQVDPSTKPSKVFLVRDPVQEGLILSRFLQAINSDLQSLKERVETGYRVYGGENHAKRKATVQFYVWDDRIRDKLKEKVGEHILVANRTRPDEEISPLAWLFPPEHALPEQGSPSEALTVVKPALRLVALALPHAYGQLEVANLFRHLREGGNREPEVFSVHYQFGEPLSDAMPSERGHELWARRSPRQDEDIAAYEARLEKAVIMRVWATLSVARKLAHELKGRLTRRARTVESLEAKPQRVFGAADDSQVIYQHAAISSAAASAEIEMIMAMPPHERESRFTSMRLTRRIEGAEKTEVLASLGIAQTDEVVWIFEIAGKSKDAKIKKGDFAFSLMPEDKLHMDGTRLDVIREKYPTVMPEIRDEDEQESKKRKRREAMTDLRSALSVSVVAINRAERVIALKPSSILVGLEELGVMDFALDEDHLAILDPLHTDMFTRRRLRPALEAIGTPDIALRSPLISQGVSRIPAGRQTPSPMDHPAADFIWNAHEMAQTLSKRSIEYATEGKERWLAGGRPLVDKQDEAFISAIQRRLTLLLGPPGTGKSATATAIIAGLIHDAVRRNVSLRLALTGPTWVAIDNVLERMPALVKKLDVEDQSMIARLRSPMSIVDDIAPILRPFTIIPSGNDDDASRTLDLIQSLQERSGIIIVGGTAGQLAALTAVATNETKMSANLFDYMIIDEASQMDVAHAIVAYNSLDRDASILVVGDDKQMSPIHPVYPPKGYEYVVGSIYDFYNKYRVKAGDRQRPFAIQNYALSQNFRSNSDIVAVSALAGYPNFKSGNPDIRLPLAPISSERPSGLPQNLPWHPQIPDILSPEAPLIALIHEDTLSSQRNTAEAHWIASMIAALRGNLGSLESLGKEVLDDVSLFKTGIGVVTPHRAQQAAVLEALFDLGFDKDATEAMYASVDTVERFQGQERLIMFASFGMGDPDQIAGEEEFLYSLNRFNVIVSRAQTKMVVVMSQSLADHLPKNYEVLKGAKLIHRYVGGKMLEEAGRFHFEGLGETRFLRKTATTHGSFP